MSVSPAVGATGGIIIIWKNDDASHFLVLWFFFDLYQIYGNWLVGQLVLDQCVWPMKR